MTRLQQIRIFLAAVALTAMACGAARAQDSYDCFYVKTAKVAQLRGVVAAHDGQPVRGAKIELFKRGVNGTVGTEESTAAGRFEFKEPGGRYMLRVQANGFQPVGVNVRVDHGFFSFFNTRKLYVVLPVSGVAQPCPAEITSKRKLQEYIRDNATQK